MFFFFSSRRRHTRSLCDWSSDVCSSDLSIAGCQQCCGTKPGFGAKTSERQKTKRACPEKLGAGCPKLGLGQSRSEERRVGKECRSRWSREQYRNKRKTTQVRTRQIMNIA